MQNPKNYQNFLKSGVSENDCSDSATVADPETS